MPFEPDSSLAPLPANFEPDPTLAVSAKGSKGKLPSTPLSQRLGITNPIGAAVVDVPADVLKGAGYEAFRMSDNLSGLVRRAFEALHIPEAQPYGQVTNPFEPPSSIAGHVGQEATAIGSFLLPSGKVTEGMRGLEAITAGSHYAPALNAMGRAGLEGAAAFIPALAQTGDPNQALTTSMFAGAAPSLISNILKPVASGALHAAGALEGKILGTGSRVLEMAATDASAAMKEAARNPGVEQHIIADVKKAADTLMHQRATEYQQGMAQLAQTAPHQLSGLPAIMQAHVKTLQDWGVAMGGPFSLDLSRSTITGKVDQSILKHVSKDLFNWDDTSLVGLDRLKQRIYSYAATDGLSAKTKPILYRLADSIANNIEQQVPGYRDVTADYKRATEFMNVVDRELGASAVNPGTIITKLSYAMNRNNNFRQSVLDAMDAAAGTKVSDQLAGMALSNWMPRGLAGVGGGLPAALAGTAAYMHDPRILLGAVMSSPRAMGEALFMISALRNRLPSAAGTPLLAGAQSRINTSYNPPDRGWKVAGLPPTPPPAK